MKNTMSMTFALVWVRAVSAPVVMSSVGTASSIGRCIGLVVLVAGGEGLRPEGRDAEASTKESVVGGDAAEYRRASSW